VGSPITYIAVNPANPTVLWITKSGYTANSKVFKSTNAGSTWINVSTGLPNIPFNCVTVHPDDSNHVYIGSDLGVFHSSNGGTTWETYDQGLPNVIVNELEIHKATNKLRAATFGRGLWEATVSIIDIESNSNDVIPDKIDLFQNYPNPFNPSTTISYQINEKNNVSLKIFNTLGQEVRTIVNQKQNPGNYSFVWDGMNNNGKAVGSGIYIYRLKLDNVVLSKKMILIK
jgi:hypothetical protein